MCIRDSADPAQRDGHEQALLADTVDKEAAGQIGNRARGELAGQDRADLRIVEPELLTDERKQEVERCRVPVRQRCV